VTLHRDPSRECHLCGRTTSWRARGSSTPWVCGVCVIPALEPEHLEWLDERPVQTNPPLTGLRFTPAPPARCELRRAPAITRSWVSPERARGGGSRRALQRVTKSAGTRTASPSEGDDCIHHDL
jgi:hypothetical protein